MDILSPLRESRRRQLYFTHYVTMINCKISLTYNCCGCNARSILKINNLRLSHSSKIDRLIDKARRRIRDTKIHNSKRSSLRKKLSQARACTHCQFWKQRATRSMVRVELNWFPPHQTASKLQKFELKKNIFIYILWEAKWNINTKMLSMCSRARRVLVSVSVCVQCALTKAVWRPRPYISVQCERMQLHTVEYNNLIWCPKKCVLLCHCEYVCARALIWSSMCERREGNHNECIRTCTVYKCRGNGMEYTNNMKKLNVFLTPSLRWSLWRWPPADTGRRDRVMINRWFVLFLRIRAERCLAFCKCHRAQKSTSSSSHVHSFNCNLLQFMSTDQPVLQCTQSYIYL